ncbi:hypothetical protein T05_12019 [Trichinella murrelli]|uniref:Uncharacterized protein n=1 Tax=Trichinella murrelli TaxID=144512 RepID=A0A0V0UDF4_9BILA|nr:hypothetical protein T05_12019 [Trichinella murrelli]
MNVFNKRLELLSVDIFYILYVKISFIRLFYNSLTKKTDHNPLSLSELVVKVRKFTLERKGCVFDYYLEHWLVHKYLDCPFVWYLFPTADDVLPLTFGQKFHPMIVVMSFPNAHLDLVTLLSLRITSVMLNDCLDWLFGSPVSTSPELFEILNHSSQINPFQEIQSNIQSQKMIDLNDSPRKIAANYAKRNIDNVDSFLQNLGQDCFASAQLSFMNSIMSYCFAIRQGSSVRVDFILKRLPFLTFINYFCVECDKLSSINTLQEEESKLQGIKLRANRKKQRRILTTVFNQYENMQMSEIDVCERKKFLFKLRSVKLHVGELIDRRDPAHSLVGLTLILAVLLCKFIFFSFASRRSRLIKVALSGTDLRDAV